MKLVINTYDIPQGNLSHQVRRNINEDLNKDPFCTILWNRERERVSEVKYSQQRPQIMAA